MAAEPAGVVSFVRDRHLNRYSDALSDLNRDNQPEALVYAMGTTAGNGEADLCGSGGCNLYVLSLAATGYRLVSSISLARPPVRVLRHSTNGWRDLGVWVAGGGINPGHEAQLRFDGHRYPANPTMAPASRTKGKMGQTVIRTLLMDR